MKTNTYSPADCKGSGFVSHGNYLVRWNVSYLSHDSGSVSICYRITQGAAVA